MSKKAKIQSAVAVVDGVAGLLTGITPFQLVDSVYFKYKETLFEEKLEAFMMGASKVTEEQKKDFLAKLDKDRDDFFKKLWNTIDRIEENEKAKVLGRLFSDTVKGEIQLADFREASSALDKVLFNTLKVFAYNPIKEDEFEHQMLIKQLVALGLACEELEYEYSERDAGEGETRKSVKVHVHMSLTSLGSLLTETVELLKL